MSLRASRQHVSAQGLSDRPAVARNPPYISYTRHKKRRLLLPIRAKHGPAILSRCSQWAAATSSQSAAQVTEVKRSCSAHACQAAMATATVQWHHVSGLHAAALSQQHQQKRERHGSHKSWQPISNAIPRTPSKRHTQRALYSTVNVLSRIKSRKMVFLWGIARGLSPPLQCLVLCP